MRFLNFLAFALIMLAAAVAQAEPIVMIQSSGVLVYHGAAHRFRAVVLDTPPDRTLEWRLESADAGTLDPTTGEFRANAEAVRTRGVLPVTVHVSLRALPGVRDTFTLQVVDPGVAARLGPETMALLSDHEPDWIGRWLRAEPFLEPESGRFPPGVPDCLGIREEWLEFQDVFGQGTKGPIGGMPVAYRSFLTVRVPKGPPGSRTLVSYGTPGGTWETVPVGDVQVLRIQARQPFTRIMMQTSIPMERGFRIVRYYAPVDVVGVLPHAGRPKAQGSRSGTGLAARFRAPAGMDLLRPNGELWVAAVCDLGAQVVWRVTSRGQVSILAGIAGVAGSADGPVAQAQFKAPTYLAVKDIPGGGDRIFVADTGNNTIRVIEDGIVRTYAGQADAPAGHADARSARDARFHRPLGLALDPGGNLYVVDAGNFVIRRIDAHPPHKVTTLAGGIGQRGSVDGPLRDSRFWQPKGLCRVGNQLYLTDGHSLRRIDLDTGQVTTLAGTAHQAGYRSGSYPVLAGQPPTPAFSDPWDIQPWQGGLLVADEGNHAIRTVAFPSQEPMTEVRLGPLAGAPSVPATRYGRAWFGDPPPQYESHGDFAGFRLPRAILVLPGSTLWDLSVLVADDSAISLCSHLNLDTRGGARMPALLPFPGSITLGEDLPVRFEVSTKTKSAAPPPPLPLRWSLDWTSATDRGHLQSGPGWPGILLEATFRPKTAGTFALVLTVLSEDGFTQSVRREILVKERREVETKAPADPSVEAPVDLPAAPPPQSQPTPQVPDQGRVDRREEKAPAKGVRKPREAPMAGTPRKKPVVNEPPAMEAGAPGTPPSPAPQPKAFAQGPEERKTAPRAKLEEEGKEMDPPAEEQAQVPAATGDLFPGPVPDDDPRPYQPVEARNPGRKRLSAQKVHLGAVARSHIAKEHVWGKKRFKSQFNAAYTATADALRAFLAEALEHRTSEVPMGRKRKRMGFICTLDQPVGIVSFRDGTTAPTRNLLVVARWDKRWEVITAYPVP